jgi:hypothetical protein
VSATSGLGDKLAVVLPGYLDVSLDDAGWLAPSFRLSVSVLPDRVITHPIGRGHLSRIAGRLGGCPIRSDLGFVVLRPCLSLEAGALIARGEAVAQPQSSANPWVAAAIGPRLQVFPMDWLLLEVDGEVGLSIVRPRFVIEPGLEIARANLLFGVFGGSVGIRFP